MSGSWISFGGYISHRRRCVGVLASVFLGDAFFAGAFFAGAFFTGVLFAGALFAGALFAGAFRAGLDFLVLLAMGSSMN
jgi:uncharacterized protein YjbI with pentapeptide repeats